MPFPSTPILANFNLPDQGPPPGPGWTTPPSHNGLKVLSSRAGNDASQGNAGLWDIAYLPNQEVYCRMAVLPVAGQYVTLYLRNQSSSEIHLVEQYSADFVINSPGQVRIYRAGTQLGTDITLAGDYAAGDQIGLRGLGSSITAWLNGVLVATRDDGAVTGAGRIAVRVSDETGRIDDFGGGEATAGVSALERLGRGICRGMGWGMR